MSRRWHDEYVMQINGQPVTADDLAALGLCNYGHFTSMRAESMRVRGLDLHLQRLIHDCQLLFGSELDAERVRRVARQVAEEAPDPVVVRVTIFDPQLELSRPADAGEPHILITTRRAAIGDLGPVTLSTRRYERDLPEVKHVGLFAPLYHRREGQRTGRDDVLFVGTDGRISEVVTSNIGFVRDGVVVWPDAPCLPGVTMRLVQEVMRQSGVPFETASIGTDELGQYRSAFLTNAAVGVRPIAAIDDTALVVDDPLTALVRKAYAELPGDLI